ncbi:MAG: peroxiredoxin [Bifidobacteriaceae bacterium]|jgi:peroxiredoxin Q/BCP|nr:peroxiredoxin [Bifidobacteriaceae bacterium]
MADLKPGDAAPDFTLESDDGPELTLSALRPKKVILYAYPAAFTPGCSLEARDFRDAYADFDAAGYVIVGISPDTAESIAGFSEKLGIQFTLVADPDHKVLEDYGAWGEHIVFGRKSIGVIRSTFVIDGDGKITLADYAVKAPGHVERLAEQLGVPLTGF